MPQEAQKRKAQSKKVVIPARLHRYAKHCGQAEAGIQSPWPTLIGRQKKYLDSPFSLSATRLQHFGAVRRVE